MIRQKLIKVFLILFVGTASFLMPLYKAYAEIIINEVAYAGTVNSQYEEWIELYNSGGGSVSLDGWIIYKNSTTLFTLSQNIAAGDYLLVCRTTGSITQPLNGSCQEQGTFGGSGLSNTGEHLILKTKEGALEDEIALIDGAWPVPQVSKSESMQKTSSGWVKAEPTPGELNQEGEAGEDDPPPQGQQSGGVIIGKGATLINLTTGNEDVEFVKPDILYSAKMTSPDYGLIGSPLPFSVLVKEDGKRDLISGTFEWYMGDGSTHTYQTNTSFKHSFSHPGTYQVTLLYYSNPFKQEPDSIHRKKITIIDPRITLSYSDEGTVTLQTEADKDIDLEGWKLEYKNKLFVFPRYTIISKKSSLSFSQEIIGFGIEPGTSLTLRSPSGKYTIEGYQEAYEEEALSAEDTESSQENIILAKESSSSPLPSLKSFAELWNLYRWYVILAGGVLSVLAYFVFRLYATRNSLITEDDNYE